MDPAILAPWLPPGEMGGEIHEFSARVAGGYRMSLFYPPDEAVFRGKTSEREDRVNVRFVALEPPRRIVQSLNFDSPEPAFHGEMTMTSTFEAVAGGTKATVLSQDLPRDLRAQDNDAGSRISLKQLACRFAT